MKTVSFPSTKPARRQLRRRNTLTPGEFSGQLVFFGLLAMVWYRSLVFRCLPGRTAAQSKTILWLALGASLVLLGALSWRERRNDLSLAGNILLPFGLYTAAAYWELFPRPILLLAVCAAALCLVHGGVMLRLGCRASFLARLRGILLGWRTIAALSLSLLLIPAFVRNTLGYAMFQPAPSAVTTEAVCTDDRLGTLLLFQDEVLVGLELQQRLDALQALCDVERTNLGLPHELIVEAGPLPMEGNLARYNDSLHRITFDLEHLLTASGEELLDTRATTPTSSVWWTPGGSCRRSTGLCSPFRWQRATTRRYSTTSGETIFSPTTTRIWRPTPVNTPPAPWSGTAWPWPSPGRGRANDPFPCPPSTFSPFRNRITATVRCQSV